MSPFERFDFLEIDEQPKPKPRPSAPRAAPRPEPTRLESDETRKTRTLVADQIIGRHGPAIGEFNCPAGLAVDATGNLYVADSYNQRVQVFRYVGGPT